MRLLLTFLFLVFMQSFVVCTKEDSSMAFVQKPVDKIDQAKKTAPIIATKEANKLIKIQSFQVLDRIHQPIFNHFSLAKNAIITKTTLFIITLNPIKRIRSKIDFSDQYILNCLYPKYTFW